MINKYLYISLFSLLFLNCGNNIKVEKIKIQQIKTDSDIRIKPFIDKDSTMINIYIPLKFKIKNINTKEILFLKAKFFTNNKWNDDTYDIYVEGEELNYNESAQPQIPQNQESEYIVFSNYLVSTKEIHGVFNRYSTSTSSFKSPDKIPIGINETFDTDENFKINKEYMKYDAVFYSKNKDFINKYQMNDSIEFIFTDFYEKDTIRKKIEIKNMFK